MRPSSRKTYKGYVENPIKPSISTLPLSKRTRACLKIEEMTNFYPEGVHFKEKTAKQSSDWRGLLTQKGAPSG
ncbi:hypothetical protein [Acutalibacter intestini]|uniref:hypothetical protein n=1 Tax=Acutalibacter intestini TaxID=3093659 RepID=UPI002AC9CBEF|nr:hypothetical protein [Acutalibacter sp. M00204]